MGATSGGKKKFLSNFKNRQRANLSFFIVVMFFGVFGIIVFTEIFFIDDKDRATGVIVKHGAIGYRGKHYQGNLEYENEFQFLDVQLPTFPENSTGSDAMWQRVNGTRFRFFVFSAYYDPRRNQRNIRIIGAAKTRGPDAVWCRFWYKSDGNSSTNSSKTVPAKIKIIRENWNLFYSACFILCPLRNLDVPVSVSVVAKLKEPPTNILTVINNYNETTSRKSISKDKWKFAVCVKPLHFNYNKDMQILEFIELNRVLGVEHFTFYNHTIGPQVDCILKDYIEKGIVTVLPWTLPLESKKEIRTEGIFAALNDCLYRMMYRYTHVLLIDFDEYIIPKFNETLPQLIDNLSKRINSNTEGSYSFQNAFFYLQWEDDNDVYDLTDPIASNLVTLKKTRRKTKLHPHKQRSKYICKPELIVEAGNHFVWEFLPGHGTLNAPSDAAILHHYRICEFGGDDCIKTPSIVDKTAYHYRNALVEAVRSRYETFKNKCQLTKPEAPPARVFQNILNMLKPAK